MSSRRRGTSTESHGAPEPTFATRDLADVEELLEAAARYVERTNGERVVAAELRQGADVVAQEVDDGDD